MKRFISIVMALILVMTSTAVFAKSGNGHGPKVNGKDKKYYNQYEDFNKSTSIFINGKEFSINNGNVIKYKNFQIPTKPITEGLGATVDWNAKTHIVTITKGNISLALNLDTKKAKVNGFEIVTSVLTSSNKNKTIVLLKFIAEVLGKNAEIKEGAATVVIEDDGSTSINDNITGNGLNQFQYSSKWNYGSQINAYLGDNHWSSSPNAYYTVRFNGTQAKLYGATSDIHGIAGVSIDNGPESYVDFYSAKRADNVLVYTSPVLSQGQHTLKVRVTGTKNTLSKGLYLTADRLNVISGGSSQSLINIALNKTVFSDSQQSENTTQKGNDGSLSTRWCAANDSANHWWTVDLGGLYNINGSEVTWEKAGKVYKYKIEVSPDNSNWTLKVDKTNNSVNQQVQKDNFNADLVRYVRIAVTGLESGCWASFSEFKVFGVNSYMDIKAPAAPAGLIVTSQASNEVTLYWNASADNVGTAGYKVFRNGTQAGTVTSGTSFRDTGLTPGTVYIYSVAAFDTAGNCSSLSNPVYAATSAFTGSGNGLVGEYYNNKDLTDLKFARRDDVVNAAWNNNSPDSRIHNETFSIRWTGQIQPLYSEAYTFCTLSDDGVRLWINGTKVIDNWTDHSTTENRGTIVLTSGQKYDIQLEYYNNIGEGKIMLEWLSSHQARQIVPKSQLYSAN